MKKRFSEEQIALALRQSETGTSVQEVVRKMGRFIEVWRIRHLRTSQAKAVRGGTPEA